MTRQSHQVVLRALDEALTMTVMNLFQVVSADTSDASIQSFADGLHKAVDLYDHLVKTLSTVESDNA